MAPATPVGTNENASADPGRMRVLAFPQWLLLVIALLFGCDEIAKMRFVLRPAVRSVAGWQ